MSTVKRVENAPKGTYIRAFPDAGGAPRALIAPNVPDRNAWLDICCYGGFVPPLLRIVFCASVQTFR